MKTIDRSRKALSMKPLAMAVAMAVAGPGAALGEELYQVPLYGNADMTRWNSNYVEIGGMYTGIDGSTKYKFGEWTGLTGDGFYGVLNGNVLKRFGDDATYVRGNAYNVGYGDSHALPMKIDVGGGTQGRWWIDGGFQSIDRYQFDTTRFIHTNLGSNNLGLPAGFTGITAGTSQPPSNAAAVNPFLRNYDIEQKRDIWKLAGGFFLGPQWNFTVNYRQDNQSGDKLIGAVIGNGGGNPRAAIVPYPLDQKTQQIEAMLQWAGTQGQFQLSYWWSKFKNDNDSLTWANPFATIAGWQGTVGSFPANVATLGRLGLMPDNTFNQIQATGAWNFTPAMRLTGTFAYSIASQDQSYLPYTVNPGITGAGAGGALAPLPRGSLDGEIKNTLFNLNYNWRIMPKLNLRAAYQYSHNDNKTPEATYLYVGGDSLNQPALNSGAPQQRTNLPPGLKQNRFKAEADYEVWNRTILRGWYQYQKLDYEAAADELRADTYTNTVGAELRRVASEYVTGAVKYIWSQRRGSDFNQNRPFAASYDPAYVTAQRFDNLPTLRQYYVANYDQNLLRAHFDISPGGPFEFQIVGDYIKREYKGPDCGGSNDQAALTTPTQVTTARFPSQCQGLQSATGYSVTLDGQWHITEAWNAYAFWTGGVMEDDQAGRNYSGNPLATKWAQSTDPTRNWNVTQRMLDSTLGIGLRFAPDSKRWDAGAQFLLNNGTTQTSLTQGQALTSAPVPDARALMTSFQLFGKYQLSKNVLLRGNYWYQRLGTNDWAFDNASATSSNNVLLTGQQSPNYNANVFFVSVAYTGW
jgi:MtrB/PioB family decaheme-associated outer membrane protein